MKITFASALHLMHEATWGSLATHSAEMPGYPFATALPFALDEQHCPVCLISGLAEHTKNLIADARASFLIHSPTGDNVLTGERISIIGNMVAISPSQDFITRYLRYHPDAREYLALGDFTFYRLTPKRSRYVAGFGQMGWLEAEEWTEAKILPLAEEKTVIHDIASMRKAPTKIFGIDYYGFDVEINGKRTRQRFPDAPIALGQMSEIVRRFLAAFE
ncbi:HugZ family pyridoxamine 5'-phosphate oxidase [Glaciimonas immobilis]|uniref:CREG-like beta-barrel domain-containing protein n=1 Tax=Glaciimonas immobilis TaxID=728004 RepID=A0A840RY44_9BURK|nr:pyridoxamine 5'-phosphate oxidase family protein [Glaciimonas immobilis]KAF3996311.1 pyridoxamine 5'-phosphate oxidase [Glaciimonas immobilis]MBB5202142.1 hypothetical protein [Glaciimonas immobilis]